MFEKERIRVAEVMRKLYERGLTTSSGGNVSMRNSEGYVFITASQSDKSVIDMRKVIVLSPDGQNLTPNLNPSMETQMHLLIYRYRQDIKAIVHSHPTFSSTFAVAGIAINSAINGEARYILGEIGNIPYKMMGTEELATVCAEIMKKHDTAIMQHHGALAVGCDLFEAYNRLEVLEETAHINYNLLVINKMQVLTEEQITEIDTLKQQK